MNNPVFAFIHELWVRFTQKSPRWAVIIQWLSGVIVVVLSTTLAANTDALEKIVLFHITIKGILFFSLTFASLLKYIIAFFVGVFGTSYLPVKDPQKMVKKLKKNSPTAKDNEKS